MKENGEDDEGGKQRKEGNGEEEHEGRNKKKGN